MNDFQPLPAVIRRFHSSVGRCKMEVLADGTIIRHGITGRMLLAADYSFSRYLDDAEQPAR